MEKANTDTTYCASELCTNKCWRHKSNYEFDENRFYWLINFCADYLDQETN